MLTDPCTPLLVPCLKMSISYLRINKIILSYLILENREKKRKNPVFSEKYAPYQTVLVGLLFVSVQSKHRNSLFRYRSETTETNVLFRIVPKLVSVPVSVVSNRN